MKVDRRIKFSLKAYNSQSGSPNHKINIDYLVLIALFFHFWGYIDVHINESIGSTSEEDVKKMLPKLHGLLIREIPAVKMSIWKTRQILAHEPMMIHLGVNMGFSQFDTGWVYDDENRVFVVKTYPKPGPDVKYFPTILESELLYLINELVAIIVKFKIPAELEYTAYTLRRSGIDLVGLACIYCPQSSFQQELLVDLNAFMRKSPDSQPRTNIVLPRNKDKYIEFALNQNKTRILQHEQLSDGRYKVVGVIPNYIGGVNVTRRVNLISGNLFDALRDLAILNNEDWILP